MPNRRRFLQGISSIPLMAAPIPAAPVKRDYFKELGVRPFINAAGVYTTLTASLMHPEAVQAIDYASKQFVHLIELHDAVGKRISSLIGCEAAMVTAGAASALTLGTAACITGTNADFIQRLPDTTGMKSEVIVQKSHRYGYDHAVRNCGIRFVEVETSDELERAVNDRTAMMLFFNANEPVGKIKSAEFVQLGQNHHVPTFTDAAADTPPVDVLSRFTKMGFDLVTFSGGKGLRGPQSCGLLLGRKDLIEAAMPCMSPSGGIGRGMKVGKEEMVGLLAAVERYLKVDHQAEIAELDGRVAYMVDSLSRIKGMKAEKTVPVIANEVPHVLLTWDESGLKITSEDVAKKLMEGDPAIAVLRQDRGNLLVSVWMMRAGEHRITTSRLRQIFS